jgi:hypothetical protein
MAAIVSQLNQITTPWVEGEPLDVIVDLSNVCRCDDNSPYPDLVLLLEALKNWKVDYGPQRKVSLVCIADKSLVRGPSGFRPGKRKGLLTLSPNDLSHIQVLKNDGRVIVADFADPLILKLAAEHPEAAVLSSDRFREFRVSEHPWLQGTERVYSCRARGNDVAVKREIYWSSPATLSRANEVNELSFLTERDRELLENSVWECPNPMCGDDPLAAVVPTPKRIRGELRFTCPSCGEIVQTSRSRKHVASVEAQVVGSPSQSVRFLVEEDVNLFIGRGPGSKNLNIANILGISDLSISRNHALITAKRLRGSPRKWRKWDLKIKRLQEASLPVTIEKFESSLNKHVSIKELEPGQSFVMTIHHRARIGDSIMLRMTGRHLPQPSKPWYSFRPSPGSSEPTRFA